MGTLCSDPERMTPSDVASMARLVRVAHARGRGPDRDRSAAGESLLWSCLERARRHDGGGGRMPRPKALAWLVDMWSRAGSPTTWPPPPRGSRWEQEPELWEQVVSAWADATPEAHGMWRRSARMGATTSVWTEIAREIGPESPERGASHG